MARRTPTLGLLDHFIPVFRHFAEAHGMSCVFDDRDGLQLYLNWHSDNDHDCYITLQHSEGIDGLTLGTHCFGPLFPQTHWVEGRRVAILTGEEDDATVTARLEEARQWSESRKEAVDPNGRPAMEPILH